MGSAVALVEEHAMVVECLCGAFDEAADLHAAGSWRRLDEAYDAWIGETPAVAVIERGLLGFDPVSSLEAIRDSLGIPVLVRARRPNVEVVQLMLDAGARGVVDSMTTSVDTVAALHAVLDSGRYVPVEHVEELMFRLMHHVEVPYMALSRRERQVAALSAGGATASEVADRLFIALPTVRTHLRRAYQKLGVRGQTEALLALIEIGVVDMSQVDRCAAARAA